MVRRVKRGKRDLWKTMGESVIVKKKRENWNLDEANKGREDRDRSPN